jgi:hypothetical protein
MTMYQTATSTALSGAVKTMLTSLVANFPDNLVFTVPSGGDELSAETGALTGSWTGGSGGAVIGTDGGAFALGSGFRVRWGTSGIVGGRRVVGQTFFVPCAGLVWSTNGDMVLGSQTSIQGTVNTFLGTMGANLVVWSRPTASRPGAISPVTSATVMRNPTALRSRRY